MNRPLLTVLRPDGTEEPIYEIRRAGSSANQHPLIALYADRLLEAARELVEVKAQLSELDA